MNFLKENILTKFFDISLFGNIWNPLQHISFQRAIDVWIGHDDSDYLFQLYINVAFICFNIMLNFTILRRRDEK